MSSFEIPGVLTPTQKALMRTWWRKVTAAHPKAQNFRNMKVPVVERGVFGIPLVESIKYAHSSISYIDDDTGAQCFGVVPTIIAKCGSFLKEEGMAVEGIFRLSGSAKRTRMLQTMFDTPDSYGAELDWRGYTVHDAAAVMKRFLNHLPDPVITLEYYRPFKDTMKMSFPTPEAKIDAFQKLIQCLPIAHQYLLLYLLDMLSLFVTAEEYTRMGTQTLASIFAPGILSHPDDELNPAGYEESKHVLQYLIENQENFSIPRPATGQAHSPIAPPPQDLPLGPPEPESTVPPKAGASYSNEHRASTLYSIATGSYSGAALDSLVCEPNNSLTRLTPGPRTSLRRSKTAPSKRSPYGEHELPQVVHVNRNPSQGGGKRAKRWTSVRRITPGNRDDAPKL